jgi:hypothetical protein
MRSPQKTIDCRDHVHREIARLPGGALHGFLFLQSLSWFNPNFRKQLAHINILWA